jgi:hypothetical protein
MVSQLIFSMANVAPCELPLRPMLEFIVVYYV